ncbi:MAG TPA: histidinol-phosphatase HisJ family protein [Verrucomicrobia bacterium]|nr:histidinol-phosphatase HisJ family protein [Verrucomicrobiota bacterium]HOB31686.1 histidinol-phosphatase HisJ family protein [Verrucomicrobiota bacterium]HOP98827.1 histidinol-phosphatase HisJ family protein [Verrucomicrobiota bacterium]HPU57380.1 histidinol-phosphatase HisJ family protein [Verrucomicrobiota bacterium]
MALPPDLHMHTPLCRHATGEPADYARRALQAGLTEIGFSDHSPMRRDDFDDWRMRNDQLDEYVESVRRAQQNFPQLTIRLALEVDYLPGQEDWIRDLASRHPWDYFIGSVHYVTDTWAVDSPFQLSQWDQRDAFEVWSAYFERLTLAAASGLFQILGHADLPKKFGHRPKQDCTPLYERLIRAAAKTGCAVELNTAGLRKECREIYPSREFLLLARQHRVPITFGSDAHAADEVGRDFASAVALAREAGYTSCLTYDQRMPRLITL